MDILAEINRVMELESRALAKLLYGDWPCELKVRTRYQYAVLVTTV